MEPEDFYGSDSIIFYIDKPRKFLELGGNSLLVDAEVDCDPNFYSKRPIIARRNASYQFHPVS